MAIDNTMTLIEAKTLTSTTASITFSAIPQTYTDLKIVYSARNTAVTGAEGFDATISFNGATANRSIRVIRGDGSNPSSNLISDPTDFRLLRAINPSDYTASVFCNTEIYIPNYTSSNIKTFNVDAVVENNATTSGLSLTTGLWNDTAAITSITLGGMNGSLAADSNFYLYGIKSSAITGTKATGGTIYQDDTHFYHVFSASGIFAPTQSITADILVVAGGGGGGNNSGAGGGAGGLLGHNSQSLTVQNYTVTVGAGGVSNTSAGDGTNGSNSQFGALTASVGGGYGGGGGVVNSNGGNGGSGGGGGGRSGGSPSGGTGTSGQGNAGGTGPNTNSKNPYGGGGGAGAVGGNGFNSSNGAGGVGSSAYSSWGLATGTGENVSGVVYYAGGGGSETGEYQGTSPFESTKNGGFGGGGGSYRGGKPGTGGGAGGNAAAAAGTSPRNGGSGIVIVRYAKV